MTVEYSSVRILAERFGKLPLEVRKKLRPKLRAAGLLVAAQAKENASFSDRISGAIRVVTSYGSRTGGVTIRIDQRKAPHARALEGTQRNTTFRHPVFGDTDAWVNQPTHPFLFPAVEAKSDEARALVADAVKSATQTLRGLHA